MTSVPYRKDCKEEEIGLGGGQTRKKRRPKKSKLEGKATSEKKREGSEEFSVKENDGEPRALRESSKSRW